MKVPCRIGIVGGSLACVGVVPGFGILVTLAGDGLVAEPKRLLEMFTFPFFCTTVCWVFRSSPGFLVTIFAITGVLVILTALLFIGVMRVVIR